MAVLMGARYVLAGPDGTRAVINDPADADFVGYLSEPPSGLDGPERREVADVRTDGDGGMHGQFRYGRRPFTLRGFLQPGSSVLVDEQRQNKLLEATDAMVADGLMTWTESVRGALILSYRTPQSTRITDRRPKTFLCSLVSEYPVIDSQTEKTATRAALVSSPGEVTAVNVGKGDAYWTIEVDVTGGTVDNLTFEFRTVSGSAASAYMRMNVALGLSLTSVDTLLLDQRSKRIRSSTGWTYPYPRPVASGTEVDQYGRLVFDVRNWVGLRPGTTYVYMAAAGTSTPAATGTLRWRDAHKT